MSILQNRCAPFAPFGAAALSLAVCYIVFWTGWMEPPETSPLLPALLAAAWIFVALALATADGARAKPTRWLCVGLAGGALTAAAVGIVLARRGGGRETGFGGMIANLSAIGAASLIALGAALIAWAWVSQSSAPVVWTTLGASAVGSGATIALSASLGE